MKLFSIVQMIANALSKPKQRLQILDIPKGRVLDIGGGGEGVIAQAGGASVVAIDKYMSEIHEAYGKAPDAQWMVTDATKLPFENRCFDNATAFFSLMYMPNIIKEHVFRETQRVLKKDGEFWIWDAQMTLTSKVFALRLQVDLPENTIKTIYGVKAKEQSTTSLFALLQQTGFETEVITDQEHWFFIRANKA